MSRHSDRFAPSTLATSSASPGMAPPAWIRWFAPTAIAVAALLAYANSFSAPFLFDDEPAIVNNATIERDSSRRSYGITVSTTCKTAMEAAGSTFGLSVDQYRQLSRAT